MEQGREEEDMKRRQDHDHHHHQRRLKPPAAARPENQLHQHQHQPQQPQKCPRCDSLNTKFCYYNNYSLSQPRYFCKACRRYWTHGGTLRNVPVGGGCRKGKRAKHAPSSSSLGGGGENSENTILPSTLAPPPPRELHVPQNIATNSGNLVIPPMGSYYLGGGFLSSLAAMQSLSQTQPFNQQVNATSAPFGGSPNLGFLQGLNLPPFSSQQAQNHQIQQQNEFYQMGNRDKSIESLYPPDQNLVQPNRPLISPWNQTLINRSTTTTTTTTNDNPTTSYPSFTSSTPGTTLIPNQWPDLPGYGHPP